MYLTTTTNTNITTRRVFAVFITPYMAVAITVATMWTGIGTTPIRFSGDKPFTTTLLLCRISTRRLYLCVHVRGGHGAGTNQVYILTTIMATLMAVGVMVGDVAMVGVTATAQTPITLGTATDMVMDTDMVTT